MLLTFLGTGGGRFATMMQRRSTGGIHLEDGVRMHIDPGPGALVRLHQEDLDPRELDAVLVTHGHPDHHGDADVLVEAMTRGGTRKRGTVLGSQSIFSNITEYAAVLSPYHQRLPESIVPLTPGDKRTVGKLALTATPAKHSDPTTVGIRRETTHGIVGFTSDTELDLSVVAAHEGSRVLVLNCTRPLKQRIEHHLCTEDAAEFVEKVKPELAILSHFGMKAIEDEPEHQAHWIWKKTGIRTVAADDGMKVRIGEILDVTPPVRSG